MEENDYAIIISFVGEYVQMSQFTRSQFNFKIDFYKSINVMKFNLFLQNNLHNINSKQ